MSLSIDDGITYFQPKYVAFGLELTEAPLKKGDIVTFKGCDEPINAKVMNVIEVVSLVGSGGWNITLKKAK